MKPNGGSPHGLVNGRDLSDAVPSASGDPTSSIPERTLIYGYRNGGESMWEPTERVVSRCVCGEDIEADDNEVSIRHAVDLHNDSVRHQQWRAWQE